MSKLRLHFALFLVLVPFGYLAMVYGSAPDPVPIHWNWRGEVDRWAPKWTLWLWPTLMMMFGLGLSAVVNKRLDPGAADDKSRLMLLFTIALLAALSCAITYQSTVATPVGMETILGVILGVFFIALGNYLPILKRNRWVGIRIPSTLKSERKWRLTHRVGGYGFVACGVLLIIAALAFGQVARAATLVGAPILLAIGLVIYAGQLPDDPDGDLV